MPDQLIAVLGGGQLGRMLALAGYPLGLRFRFLDPAPDAPAGQLAEHLAEAYEADGLRQAVAGAEAVTYEFENVPVAAARALEAMLPVFPPPAALEAAQDRLAEKQFFTRLGAATPPFAPIKDRAALDDALAQIGVPAVLKTRRMGYDGKGQVVLRHDDEADAAWAALGDVPLILEGFVPFARELSIIAARGRDGATAFYPLVENHHHNGILRRSLAPAPGLTAALQAQAEQIAEAALDALGYVGVLAIELFEVGDGRRKTEDEGRKTEDERRFGVQPGFVAADTQPSSFVLRPSSLVVNEMAPRVHNSGHWSIEGAETSQFENHLRAILGLPLGSTAARGWSAMLNLIGTLPDPAAVLAVRGAHLHLYGKAPRPGRKLGHITVLADDQQQLGERLAALDALL